MKHRRRIDRLYERRSGYWTEYRVPYISVPTEGDIAAALAGLPANFTGPVKIYVGISPDDWDNDNEAQTTIGAAAQ